VSQRQGKSAGHGAGRARFIDAAARVFVARGYDGSTIRMIAAEAGTSLARLSLHWSGKEQLFADVLALHFEAIHAEQYARFSQLPEHGGADERLHGILVAFFGPGFARTMGAPSDEIGPQVYSRAIVDPASEVRAIVSGLARPMIDRVRELLREALPMLSEPVFALVRNIVFAAYIHPQVYGLHFGAEGEGGAIDPEFAAQTLATIICKGVVGLDGTGG
jgi:AcrR family transcriptional regulator